MMRDFFYDLADYWVEAGAFEKSNFWARIQKGLLQGKIVRKNGSYFRFKPRLWEETR